MKDVAFVFDPVFWAVNFADGRGEITRWAKVTKDVGQAIWVGATKAIITVVVAVLARQKADAAGGANRVLCDGCVTTHTFNGHAIQIRRLHIGVALVA